MKFKFNPKVMLARLKLVENTVDRGAAMPILGNCLITVAGGRCQVTGFDMSAAITVVVPVEIESEGSVTVPAKKMSSICGTFAGNESAEFAVSDKGAVIRSGRSRFSLPTLPAVEFPAPPKVEGEEIEVAAVELLGAVNRVSHAMSKNDVRHYLNGVLFSLDKQELCCVATDGHRLATYTRPMEHGKSAQAILPNKTVGLLLKMLADKGMIKFKMGKNHAQFYADDVCLTSNLIDGKYPDYAQVIPQRNAPLVTDKRKFMKILGGASIVDEKLSGAVITIKNNILSVSSSGGGGEYSDEMEAMFEGEIEIGLCATYLIDVMKVVDTDSVRMYFSGSNSGVRIENDDDNGRLTCVVMPIRL